MLSNIRDDIDVLDVVTVNKNINNSQAVKKKRRGCNPAITILLKFTIVSRLDS